MPKQASLAERIMEYAEALPEATPIRPRDVIHLGKRASVNKTLSRLTRSDDLLRIYRGIYMRPIPTRFGLRGPRRRKALDALQELWSETIVPTGGSAANCLGLTTQNPVRSVYLTSGPSRRLCFGAHPVELRHAPGWLLFAPHSKAGQVVRALAWLHRHEADDALKAVLPTLSEEEITELSVARAVVPIWMADALSAHLPRG